MLTNTIFKDKNNDFKAFSFGFILYVIKKNSYRGLIQSPLKIEELLKSCCFGVSYFIVYSI